MSAGASKAEALDAADPLRGKRELFQLPAGVIYLDGNSLGPPPKAAFAELRAGGATGMGRRPDPQLERAGWWTLTDTLGDRIGRLIGADAGETVVTDTTSINVFKALHAALALRPEPPRHPGRARQLSHRPLHGRRRCRVAPGQRAAPGSRQRRPRRP